MGKWMDGYLEKLADVKEANIKGGGEDRAALMSQLGKLTARERIDKLLDKGSFEEIGQLPYRLITNSSGHHGIINGVQHNRSAINFTEPHNNPVRWT